MAEGLQFIHKAATTSSLHSCAGAEIQHGLSQHRLGDGGRAGIVGKVAERDLGRAACRADRLGHRLGAPAAAAVDDHLRARGGKRLRDRRTDARREADHQRALSIQL